MLFYVYGTEDRNRNLGIYKTV